MRRISLLLLLLSVLAMPCWADGIGDGFIREIGGLVAAWLLSPILGLAVSEFTGVRAKGCATMLAACAVGVVASTACLYLLFQFSSIAYQLSYLVASLAGAGSTVWVIFRSRQRVEDDLQGPGGN